MPIFRRFTASRPPSTLAAELSLEPGERVLAWSTLLGGGVVAATLDGLRVLTPHGRAVRRDWVEVRQASWDGASGTLALTWVQGRQVTPLELTAPGRLPEVVHERVRASLLLSREVDVPGGRSVWVALRRGAEGSVTTQVVPAPGVRLDDPVTAGAVHRAELALRDEVGAVLGPAETKAAGAGGAGAGGA